MEKKEKKLQELFLIQVRCLGQFNVDSLLFVLREKPTVTQKEQAAAMERKELNPSVPNPFTLFLIHLILSDRLMLVLFLLIYDEI